MPLRKHLLPVFFCSADSPRALALSNVRIHGYGCKSWHSAWVSGIQRCIFLKIVIRLALVARSENWFNENTSSCIGFHKSATTKQFCDEFHWYRFLVPAASKTKKQAYHCLASRIILRQVEENVSVPTDLILNCANLQNALTR